MVILFLVLALRGVPHRSRPSVGPPPTVPRASPGLGRIAATMGVFLVVAFGLSMLLSGTAIATADRGVALGIIMLSLLLLTGYGGHVSLCQLTLAGLGAYAMSKVGGPGGSPVGLLAAIGLAAAVGAILSVATSRLRGIYMALATLAFAVAMDDAFFGNDRFFGASLSLVVARPHVPGLSFTGDRSYLMGLCVVFAISGASLVLVRHGRFGRRLAAMSDNPLACATIGMSTGPTNALLFGLAGGLAGLGGALYGGAQAAVGPNDFTFLLSLTVFLLAVVWGIRTVPGMLLGGLTLAVGPVIQSHVATPPDVVALFVGLAALGVARAPQGTVRHRVYPQSPWRGATR